jgi:hypothetical protein
MDIAKKIFLALLGLSFIVTGGYIYLDKNRPGTVLGMEDLQKKITEKLPAKEEIEKKIPLEKIPVLKAVETDSIKEAAGATSNQIEDLTERATEVKEHLTNIIDEVKEDDGVPVHEKAFEYGQYLYCQQVVKDYSEE